MGKYQLSDFIEIHDPQVTAAALTAEIQERVRRRRREAGEAPIVFASYGAITACPEIPPNLPYHPNLYHHLRQANRLYNQAETAAILAPSPATRVPLLGRLWPLIRSQAHSLVLFYVNRAVAEQLNVNRHLVSVVNELTAVTQAQQQTISQLQQELQTLQRQVEQSNKESG